MRYLSIFIAAVFLQLAASAQNQRENSKSPDEEIRVNREYDERGNLLRYDSSYIFRWHNDTTFQFPDFGGWNDIFNRQSPFLDLFQGTFPSDSLWSGMPLFRDLPGRFFDSPEWFGAFSFPDSSLFQNFSFQWDSTLFIGPDSTFILPPGFIMPNMNSLRDLLKDFGEFPDEFAPFFGHPDRRFDRFSDEKIMQEWQELMEKHKREMDELYRKWEKSEKQQIY
ncbi:MAG: hypothetical protein ACOZDD_06025 [Bacteroidota bacterium]